MPARVPPEQVVERDAAARAQHLARRPPALPGVQPGEDGHLTLGRVVGLLSRNVLAADHVFAVLLRRCEGYFCIDTPDHTMAEVVAQLDLLPSLASKPMLLREVSAQLFWGMSTALDKRQGLVAAILGLDECLFLESPIQLQVHLPPAGYREVLFIENLMSFEQALRSTSGAFDGLALVYASRFKGSALRLRSPAGCSLFYGSTGALGGGIKDAFEAWLFGRGVAPVYFWGDLDYAGMRILSAMRSSFPGLSAWRPGYAPMLSALLAGQGHSPEAAEKQGQRPLTTTGCAYADSDLISVLAKTGRHVDQELFAL